MSSEPSSGIWWVRQAGARLFVILTVGVAPLAAQTAAPVPPPIGAVVGKMPADLWHFISWDTGAVLGIGGAAAVIGHQWDDDLAKEVETNVSLNSAMSPGATYGSFSVQAFIGVGLYGAGWFAKKERMARSGGDIMRAQVLSQIYVQALKYSVQRQRPDESNHHSFPSGHSASAFATAGVLQRHYGWKVGVPATVVAAYVATSRVHDNRHYLSDVIFGAAMGVAAQRTVTLHAGRYGFALVPVTGAGRVAVFAAVHPRSASANP